MSRENVELATRIMSSLPLDDIAGAIRDPGQLETMTAALEPAVDPEVEVARIGPEYTGEGITYRGLAGFLAFWTDWLEPWKSFSINTEEFLDAGDKVVQLVRLTGRTEAEAAPIESRAAAVMTFRDRMLTRAEFHLDPARALKAAGLAK